MLEYIRGRPITFFKICAIIVISLFMPGFIFAQDQDGNSEIVSRGSIPEELLRPNRNENPRYAVDTVIGPLGRGQSPEEAYRFARQIAAALLAKNIDAPSLAAMNKASVESLAGVLGQIEPHAFRLGGGREENDGSVSFLLRFIGREQAITGELFVRYEEIPAAVKPAPPEADPSAETEPAVPSTAANPAEDDETVRAASPAPETEIASPAETAVVRPEEVTPPQKKWIFEDLLLEDPQVRGSESETDPRFDFAPYQRLF